ncbi:MAG: hypothetical protein JJ959_16665 [Nisaea sp.]|jgi:hypothetical protein|uniref:hypothetical protein n=1 Tax=Nisaea sp. TaxID=2024842 RepID=UPI001B29D631|nr:hypothetical protein [Nisaea sp.]MBO6562179.1 hypothetical protein [Nisaea sp.]
MDRARPVVFRGLALAALVMVLLAGCRESEQDRVLLYKKGTYLGAKDQSLSEEALTEIRERGRLQSFDL